MKKILLLGAMLLCSRFVALAQFSGSGDGTEESPYLIFNVTQLSQMSNFGGKSGVVFRLMKDLDMSEWIAENNPRQGWSPVGVSATPFKGKLVGDNHTISGLSISRPSESYVGFFGYLSGATISNLTIEGSDVTGNSHVGTFAGYATGCTITNCHVKLTGKVSSSSGSYIGGFIGTSSGCTISNFSIDAAVISTGASFVGGFGGSVSGTLSNGKVNCNVTSSKSYTGGFAGTTLSATITDVIVTGDIKGTTHVGGFIGKSDAVDILIRCTYIGDLTGNENIGGISAFLSAGSSSFFTSCNTKGKITAIGDYVGGIVGASQGSCIEGLNNCSHWGDITGASYVGGLLGSRNYNGTFTAPVLHTYMIRTEKYIRDNPTTSTGSHFRTYSDNITEGTIKDIIINDCVSIGNISGKDYIGGLIGSDISSDEFTKSSVNYNYKNVTSSYTIYTWYLFKDGVYVDHYSNMTGSEAFIGVNFTVYTYTRNTMPIILKNSYFSGNVKGSINVGGIVGYKSGGSIINNYSLATIQGSSSVGGIVGKMEGNTKVSGVYNTTIVQSNVSNVLSISATMNNVGRVYGSAQTGYTSIGTLGSTLGNRSLVTNKVLKNGIVQEVNDDLQNGTSIGISLLKLRATYEALGWNFDNDWNILEEEGFPYKKYQAAPPVITSKLESQSTTISGTSANGGIIYLYYKDKEPISTVCDGNDWSFTTDPLQSGAKIQLYADVEGLTPSYFTTATVSYPGKGTETEPYLVYTAEDLQGISKSGHYKLMNDIDLSEWINDNSPTEGWPAVGRNGLETIYFDGGSHKITGLWVDTSNDNNGLFANCISGQIKNVTVEVAEGKTVKGGDNTGILIGYSANTNIHNCKVKGDVKGTLHVGGVAGFMENNEVSGVIYTGNVLSNTDGAFAGGIVAQMDGGKLVSCEVEGEIESVLYTGGLVGFSSNSQLDSLKFNGKLSSSADRAYVGGLIGKTDDCSLTNSNARLTITTTGNSTYVGGAIGHSNNGEVANCISNDDITTIGTENYVGGLIGYSNTSITQSCANGSISVSGDDSFTGGLVGYSRNCITNSYSTTNVIGTKYTAGLVAYSFSSIDKCYAKGNVTGQSYGAGIVGNMDGPAAATTNCVALNSTLLLNEQTSWGCRVIGGFGNGCEDPDESNYALASMQVILNGRLTKKEDDIVEGISKTQKELMQKDTYVSMGWDMDNIWTIYEDKTYPYFVDMLGNELVVAILFDDKEIQIIEGKTSTIKTTILPLSESYKALNWLSDNPDVVTVDNGIITAVAEGIATITAMSTDGSNISVSCAVTVLPNLEAEIAELQNLLDKAQKLYDNSTEGDKRGQYAIGSRASLLAIIQRVSELISNTMSRVALDECFSAMNDAIESFESKKVTMLISMIKADKEQTNDMVTLSWSANDENIEDYNIYYSENDQPFVLWLSNTTKTSVTFKGQTGTTYRFSVTVRDKDGGRERLDESKFVIVIFN